MKTTALAALMAIAALTFATPALAQEAAAPDPAAAADEPAQEEENFESSHLKAAQEVIALTRSDQIFDEIIPKLASQTQQIFTRANPALTREIEETAMEAALEMARRRVELSRTLQLIWARRFTEEELRELAAFFATPVGEKFVEETPVIAALSVGAGRQWEEALSADMVQLTREKLQAKGYAL